ncbi:hypothetical protein SDC9_151758 [bioreactor metagenome]|uniref:Uncharacterized protein n=1 Tax=bioreactor metagenome TaxID=1076179 RepID=A0A645ERR1_9ZZZZ
MFDFSFLVGEFHIESFREILSQEVRRSRLKSFPVLHQCFNTIGFISSGKSFGWGFDAFNHWNCHEIFGKVCVNLKHFLGFLYGFFLCGMRGVAFLPKKFGSSQE